MANFYHPDLSLDNQQIDLSREESQHLTKTLRAKVGDVIRLIDGKGQVANAKIDVLPKNRGNVSCTIIDLQKLPEPSTKIHLYLASPRHNILTGLIKQCVELGIWEIHFIDCEFSVAKPKDKADSLLKDIISGAKQSGNGHFPKMQNLVKFKDALQNCPIPKILGAVPADNFEQYSKNERSDELALWIGPEGGFSENEKELLKEAGAKSICIGDWVLRVETAVVGLASILNH